MFEAVRSTKEYKDLAQVSYLAFILLSMSFLAAQDSGVGFFLLMIPIFILYLAFFCLYGATLTKAFKNSILVFSPNTDLLADIGVLLGFFICIFPFAALIYLYLRDLPIFL